MGAYPDALHPDKVGSYPALMKAGGGYVWDAVLEYRVWCCPALGAEDIHDGEDYFHAFANHADADAFAKHTPGADEPLALVLQREYIDEPEPEHYVHVKEERMTEWPLCFLTRPQRTNRTIPDFLAPNAPANRLEILRGEV